VTLDASGTIGENNTASITAGTLSTSSVGGTTLDNANEVDSFHAGNTTSGSVALVNTATTLTVTGVSESGGGMFRSTTSERWI
jgi:hypothetical protein